MKLSSTSLLVVSSLVAVVTTTGQRQCQRLLPASGAKGGVRRLVQAFANKTVSPMSIAGKTAT